MATRNFYLRNADRYFVAIEPSKPNNFFYSDFIESLEELACNLGFEPCYDEGWKKEIEKMANNLRDYYGNVLHCHCEFKYVDIAGWTWCVDLVPILRAGYYSDACLDYFIQLRSPDRDNLQNEDVNTECIRELVDEYVDYQNEYETWFNEHQREELKDAIIDLVGKATDKFYEFAEECVAEHTLEEYVCCGVLSNGSAIYLNKTELKKRALKKEES